MGVTEPPFQGLLILSKADTDQGWKFGEFEDAIDAMPAGPDRDRQRMYFDALRTLAAFVQHGDRKPEQQRLMCVGDVDIERGRRPRPEHGRREHVQRRRRCSSARAPRVAPTPVAMIQDLGATYGSSGQDDDADQQDPPGVVVRSGGCSSRRSTKPARGRRPAAWTSRRRFTAGGHANASAPVSEAGRKFLADQLARLSDAHIRALFEAARLDALGDKVAWTDPKTGQVLQGLDAWVAAFTQKREQVAGARCGQATPSTH